MEEGNNMEEKKNTDKYFKIVDEFAAKLTRRMIQFRWLVVASAVLLTFGISSGAKYLQFSSNYRVFFSQENPELTAFENLQTTYTKNDNFLFVIEPEDGHVFSNKTLAAVEELTREAWKIPYAIRVDSITNFQHTRGIGDDLIVEDLVRGAGSLTKAELQKKASVALTEPLLRDQLITSDGRITAVNVILQYPEKSRSEVPEAAKAGRALRDSIEQAYPGIDISLTGVSMLNNAFMEAGRSDMASLVPTMFLVILVLTLLILRSISGTIATLLVIIASTIVAMGVAGFTGVKLTPISGSAPTVILTLAIADSIHLLISLKTAMREGMGKYDAMVEAVRLNFLPVFITSITTIVGFLALNFSDSPPFWHLGNISAVGIGAAWLFSVTLLPALIAILPLRVAKSKNGNQDSHAMDVLSNFVIKHYRRLLIGVGTGSVIFMAFIPAVQFDDQWIEYFDPSIEFRRDSDQALKDFGLYPIEYSVPAAQEGGVSDPEYLRNLERFTEFLRKQPNVTHVYSLTDIMKRLNYNMHSDDSAYYKIPDDHALSAQYLLLYELSLPYGLDLNDRININKSATRVTATLSKTTTVETKRFLNTTKAWIKDNLPEYMEARPTSAQVMFTYITDRNVNSMINGTLAAIAAIGLIMILSLRSLPMGLLSIITNGLPILVTFGTWGLLVGKVGFSFAAVASISLGIIVDDTVHFLSKYMRGREERGLSTEEAIRYAFRNVGVAIVVNTIILLIGFLVLTTSAFKINNDMGVLTALAIGFALILDFLLLPALLLTFRHGPAQKQYEGDIPMPQEASVSRAVSNSIGLLLTGAFIASIILASPPAMAANSKLTEVRGATPEARKGFTIAAQADRSDRGFTDSSVKLTMILHNAAGEETSRHMNIATLEVPDESVGDKSLVVFDSPADIEGTALLSHAKILTPDNQWLYLPALKRVKRISSANKSGPFVGSEFAFEDFTSLELNKFDYTWIREEACDKLKCNVIERKPRYENSGYSRQLAWVDDTDHQVRKVEFYDRRGDLLKTLTLEKYHNYNGVWRAHHLTMINHQTKKSTEMIFDQYKFKTGLNDRDFIKTRLAKLR